MAPVDGRIWIMPCKHLSASVHSGYARMRRAMVFGSHHSPHPCTTAVEQGTEPTTRLPSPTAAHFWCCPLLLLQGTGGAAAPGPWARPSAFRVNHLFSCPVAFSHPASSSEASQGIKACVHWGGWNVGAAACSAAPTAPFIRSKVSREAAQGRHRTHLGK